MEEEPILTEEDLDRAARVIPPAKLSRFLSKLGKLHEFMEASQDPFGKAFVARLNSEMLRLENLILTGKDEDPDVKKARVEYEIRKDDASWVISKIDDYKRGVVMLKRASEKKG